MAYRPVSNPRKGQSVNEGKADFTCASPPHLPSLPDQAHLLVLHGPAPPSLLRPVRGPRSDFGRTSRPPQDLTVPALPAPVWQPKVKGGVPLPLPVAPGG